MRDFQRILKQSPKVFRRTERDTSLIDHRLSDTIGQGSSNFVFFLNYLKSLMKKINLKLFRNVQLVFETRKRIPNNRSSKWQELQGLGVFISFYL